jgi:hypothetical protein
MSILAGLRDEVVDSVLVKKNNCSLNFGFGSLILRHNGTVEFKSSGAVVYPEEDKIPACQEIDNISHVSKKSNISRPAKDT